MEYAVNAHKLKVYAASSHNRQDVEQLIIQGKWVEKWGFAIGSNVQVECYQNKVVILKMTDRIFEEWIGLHIVFWNDTVYNNGRRKTISKELFIRRYQDYFGNGITYKIQQEEQ